MYYQENSDDCLRSSIRNYLILLYKDENAGKAFISKSVNNLLKAKEFLLEYNISTKGYLVDDLNQIDKSNFPLICQINNCNSSHFVVVKKIDKKYVYYIDSDNGEIKIEKDEFKKIFLNNVLLLKSKENKNRIVNNSLLKTSEKLIYFFFYLIDTISITFSFFLLNQKDAFPINLIILICSFIPIIFLNFYNIKTKDKLDKRLLSSYLKKYPSKENFIYLTKYIDESLKKINYLISYFTLLTALTIFISFNSLNYIYVISMTLLFSLLVIFNKDNNVIKFRCKQKETIIKEKLDEGEFLEKDYKNLKKDIKTLSIKILSPNIFLVLFLTLIILLNIYNDNNFSADSYIFYIFFSLTYFSSFIKLSNQILSNNKIIYYSSELSNDIDEFLVKKRNKLFYTNRRKYSLMEVENAEFRDKT